MKGRNKDFIDRIRAALLCAGRKGHLKGVNLRPVGDRLRVEAVNGHILFASSAPAVFTKSERNFEIFLTEGEANGVINALERVGGGEFRIRASQRRFECGRTTIRFRQPFKEGFPDVDIILDAETKAEPAGPMTFTPAYLEMIGRISTLLGQDMVQVEFHGGPVDAARFRADNFQIALMPCKDYHHPEAP